MANDGQSSLLLDSLLKLQKWNEKIKTLKDRNCSTQEMLVTSREGRRQEVRWLLWYGVRSRFALQGPKEIWNLEMAGATEER